jgi:hypothetical protein
MAEYFVGGEYHAGVLYSDGRGRLRLLCIG